MAEPFVKTFNRDYVRISPIPNASALVAIDQSMEDYNTVHPHPWLAYAHPRSTSFPNPPRVRFNRVNSTSERRSYRPNIATDRALFSNKNEARPFPLLGLTAAGAICPTPKCPRSHSRISSVPGCLKISLSGNHKLPGYGVLSRMTLRFGLNIEAQAEKVDVVLIRVEHFASRSTLTKASSPFSYPPRFSLL